VFIIAAVVVFALDWLSAIGVVVSSSKLLSFPALTSLGLLLISLDLVVGMSLFHRKK
jgi:hypothetical protein